MTNSFSDLNNHVEATNFVIFGATGDLTVRKLIPSIYKLYTNGLIHPETKIFGFARRKKSDEEFRDDLTRGIKNFFPHLQQTGDWQKFIKSIFYHRGSFDDLSSYEEFFHSTITKSRSIAKNFIFYLAVSPDQCLVILENFQKYKLEHIGGGWKRIVCEKPFGKNYETAQHLNQLLKSLLPEQQIFRMDHYLGKELTQNLMFLRFANGIFNPLWNAKYIEHIQITATEQLGIAGRAGYYNSSGAIRDMIQNHLLQVLALVTMESPQRLDADTIRDEKVKVFHALDILRYDQINDFVVRGQYVDGNINGQTLLGYRQEEGIPTESTTETYVALELRIDNERWKNVPFFIRTGKRLTEQATEIAIFFKKTEYLPVYQSKDIDVPSNLLLIRLSPEQEINFIVNSKIPGKSDTMHPISLMFNYNEFYKNQIPDAYERLLMDIFTGNLTLFTRGDEVEVLWTFIDKIIVACEKQNDNFFFYPAGTWGPIESNKLLNRYGFQWRLPVN